jgi:hypothetical protein
MTDREMQTTIYYLAKKNQLKYELYRKCALILSVVNLITFKNIGKKCHTNK